jgi:hypothetical protein
MFHFCTGRAEGAGIGWSQQNVSALLSLGGLFTRSSRRRAAIRTGRGNARTKFDSKDAQRRAGCQQITLAP